MKKHIARILAVVFILSVCITPISALGAYNGHTWKKVRTTTNYTRAGSKHVRTVTDYYKCTHQGCTATDAKARTYTENHISQQKDGDPVLENNPTGQYTDAGHPYKWCQYYKKCPCGFEYTPFRWTVTIPHTKHSHSVNIGGGKKKYWESCAYCGWKTEPYVFSANH